MGHLIFVVLHLLAVLFGFVLLFITIPLHLIYSAVRKPKVRIDPSKPLSKQPEAIIAIVAPILWIAAGLYLWWATTR